MLFPLGDHGRRVDRVAVDYDDRDLRDRAPDGAVYVLPDAPVKDRRSGPTCSATSSTTSSATGRWRSSPTGPEALLARRRDGRSDFAARCTAAADDARPTSEAAKLRDKYEAKARTLQDAAAGRPGPGRAAEGPAEVEQGRQQRSAVDRRQHPRQLPRRQEAVERAGEGGRLARRHRQPARPVVRRRPSGSTRRRTRWSGSQARLAEVEAELAERARRDQRGVGGQGGRRADGARDPGEDRRRGHPAGPAWPGCPWPERRPIGAASLAIDQGTSATKALVVDDDGTVLRPRSTCPVAVHAGADGAVEVDPEELWDSVVGGRTGRAGRRRSARVDGVGLANQGETVLAWDRATGRPRGRAIVWQDGRVGRPCATRLPRARPSASTPLTGLQLDPYFVGAQDGVAARPQARRRRRRDHHDRRLAAAPALWRRLRHRRGHRVALAAARPRPRGVERRGVRGCSASTRPRCPTIVDNAGAVGDTTAFGARRAGRGRVRRPAGGAVRRVLLGRRRGQVHLRHGRLPAGHHRRGPPARPTGWSAAWPGGSAAQPTWCLDGQVFTVGRRRGLAASSSASSPTPADLDRLGGTRGRRRRRHVRARRWPGSGAPFWAPDARGAFTGLSLATERAHLVRAVIEGIAAKVAWLARAAGRRPRRAAAAPAGRRRPHPLAHAAAGARPTCCRCPSRSTRRPTPPRSASPPSPGSASGGWHRGRGASAAWEPVAVVEPPSAPTRPSERLTAWRRVAEATPRPVSADRADGAVDVAVVGAGVVGAAVARLLSHHRAAGGAGGGGRRRGRRHVQGQHRHPPHRLRRHAGHGRVPAGGPGLGAAAGLRPDASASPWSSTGAVLVAWDDEQLGPPARAGRQSRGERLPRRPTTGRRRRAVRPRAAPRARARSARWSCPTSTSSTRGRRRWPSPPRRWPTAPCCGAGHPSPR